MRLFACTLIASVAATLLGMGCSATAAQAAGPGVYQVSDDLASDVAASQQAEPRACEGHPGVIANMYDRFVNPGKDDPCWSFTADAVVLQRSTAQNQSLFQESGGTAELLNAQHLDFAAPIGFQLSAVRHGPCGWDLEWGYFQIDGFSANALVPGTSDMITSAGSPPFSVTDGEASYTSALHLAEFNVRRQWCEGLTVLAGFRAGELNEIYNASGLDVSSVARDSLNTKTFNHLYGFQLGADWEFFNMGGPLRISALCKSGIYGNAASQRSRQIDSVNATDLTLEAGRNQATFMGEAGVMASYDVTRHLTFRAFGQATWIEGVALAPEQISETNFGAGAAAIDTHGGIFYYGGGLGMELKF